MSEIDLAAAIAIVAGVGFIIFTVWDNVTNGD